MKIIERNAYLDEIKDVMLTPDVKVITGVRRSGKSKILEALIEYINTKDPNGNIIHINYNISDYEELLEYHFLEKYVEKHFKAGCNNYLLIDEIQMCPSFEKAINSLHAREKYDIYVTGSNAFLQSSDLATLLVGRTYEIHIFPFSFSEYIKYYPTDNYYLALSNYIVEGGMSGSYLYKKENQKSRYINDEVLNALVVRDIINKYKVRNAPLLHTLLDFLMDNIGNVTSIRSISRSLAQTKDSADHKTIGNYINYLCRAFAFYRVRRYDIRRKRYLRSEDKYYLSDHSFRFARLGTKNMDYGRVLENIVAIELLRNGYEVYVGILYKKEIDFVAIKNGKKTYIQVANDISIPETFEREISPLLSIKDAYPRILISRIMQPEYQYEGIRIIDAADWLRSFAPQNLKIANFGE